MRILLAEDDPMLGDGLRAGLRQLGFAVDWVRDGVAAERELLSGDYVAADLAPVALALEADVPCPVAGDETLLGVLVRNLLDNALRYSPDGAQILVQVAQAAGQATLQVHDSGPGMSEAEMSRLGERFFRVPGQSQPGSGLGWSIVQRIVKVFGAGRQVSRSELLGGLAVTVRWPAP